MRRVLMSLLVCLVAAPAAFAQPDLQLWIPGATYDATETWCTDETSFDLYVIGQGGLEDVLLSVALEGFDENSDLTGISVTVDGTTYSDWQWGIPPLATINDGPPGDLGPHDIYPTWFLEIDAGDFAEVGTIGNTNEGWDPSSGYATEGNTLGEAKIFSVELNGLTGDQGAHFDAYTLDGENRIDQFAPFSHDAGYCPPGTTPIPEPTTLALFGLGLAGAGVVRRFKK